MTTNRVEWVDTAKGLGLLLVFIGHLKTPFLATWAYTFHMPLFFFLSGLFYKHVYYKHVITKRFERLVIPYFCLGFVIFTVWCIIYAFQGKSNDEYWNMLCDFLIQRGFWTIWFLAALFIASILQWGMVYIAKDRKSLIFILSLTLCLLAFIYYRSGGTVLPWCIDIACVAQFFMNIGYLTKKLFLNGLPKVKSVLLVIIFLVINVVAGFACIRLSGNSLDMSIGMYGNEILSVVSALGGIGTIVYLSQLFSSSWVTYLGKNTMILFAWHSRIIIVLCGLMYESLGWFQQHTMFEQFFYTIVTLVIILFVLIPITEIIKKSKYRTLFGI